MSAFTDALQLVLIQHNPQRTNTPIDVLAEHMAASLRLFESTLIARSQHPFYDMGKRYAEAPDVVSSAVPRFVHGPDDDPIPNVPCPSCEE